MMHPVVVFLLIVVAVCSIYLATESDDDDWRWLG